MEIIIALCLGITLSAACGFRVFIPPLAMSLAAIYGHFPLSSGFEWLGSTEAAIALVIATILEIAAYYIPLVDNLLDTVQVPIAVGVGTVITAATLGHTDPVLQWTLAAIAVYFRSYLSSLDSGNYFDCTNHRYHQNIN